MDIGYLLFVEILQITEYPGSPFTGNPMVDIVEFFIIPTILMIVFIDVILKSLPITGKMGAATKMFFGVAIYLYLIVGGYFKIFALLAGPYFLFMIFIIGGLYFLGAHFGRGQGIKSIGNETSGPNFLPAIISNELKEMEEKKLLLEKQLAEIQMQENEAKNNLKLSPTKDAQLALNEIYREKREMQKQLKEIEKEIRNKKKVF